MALCAALVIAGSEIHRFLAPPAYRADALIELHQDPDDGPPDRAACAMRDRLRAAVTSGAILPAHAGSLGDDASDPARTERQRFDPRVFRDPSHRLAIDVVPDAAARLRLSVHGYDPSAAATLVDEIANGALRLQLREEQEQVLAAARQREAAERQAGLAAEAYARFRSTVRAGDLDPRLSELADEVVARDGGGAPDPSPSDPPDSQSDPSSALDAVAAEQRELFQLTVALRTSRRELQHARAEEQRLRGRLDESSLRIVSYAVPARIAERPGRVETYLTSIGGFVVFGALGTLLVGCGRYLNAKRRHSSTDGGRSPYALVPSGQESGTFAATARSARRGDPWAVARGLAPQLVVEGVRSLATRLWFDLHGHAPKIVAFVGAGPADGCTEVTILLGAVLAGGGRRVLIVSRGGATDDQVRALFGAVGASKHRSRPVPSPEIPGLFLLPLQPGQTQARELSDAVLRGYDLVLIDAGEAESSAETPGPYPVAHATLLIVRAGPGEIDRRSRALASLRAAGITVRGFVLNDAAVTLDPGHWL
ncbi:MAG: hypothetical protein U1E83_07240 [Methylotetracoccus sp.]